MALSFHVDRCGLGGVDGWIDDDGPVESIEVHFNGQWVCNVVPNIHRPDVEAAGYGDGRRGFHVSLARCARFIRFAENHITIKLNGNPIYEGLVGSPIELLEEMRVRLDRAEAFIRDVGRTLRWEQYRIDAALFGAEGLDWLRDTFLEAKATADYQSAFVKDNPLVSVCVTTMNRAEILVERALASIITQSYRNLQIIVVGDHCTDDTAERIAGLGDSRIVFVNLPRRGPYPQPDPREGNDRWRVAGTHPANRALALVAGEFVTHLDEDDTFEPRRIEILLQKIRDVRADLVFHPFWWQWSDGGGWDQCGNGHFAHGQIGTGMVLYHHYLARVPFDVYAYRFGEPGDWNRMRKFKMMRARVEFVPEPLTRKYRMPLREPFVPENGEEFLD
jgi:hypothetical protein